MKLDVGCGCRGPRFGGFLGVDIAPKRDDVTTPYLQMDFVHDPLPWPDGSVDEIVCLHMIEHLSRADGVELLRRIWRLLAPGAVATVTCPDLRIFCERYLAGDAAFWSATYEHGRDIWPGVTLGDRLNWAVHEETHVWLYDLESLMAVAIEAGVPHPSPKRSYYPLAPMEPGNTYNTRTDHETGIVLRKDCGK